MSSPPFTEQPTWNPFGALPELPEADVGMQWNSIVDFWADPCEAPLDVYLRTALPFLGAAILVLLTPDVTEILETYVEPRRFTDCGKSRRTQRGNGRQGWSSRNGLPFRVGLPDVDEFIANLLPGRDFFEGRKHGAEEFIFWRLFNASENLGYKLLIFDLVGRSLYGWHSALLETEFCQESSQQVAKIIGGTWIEGPQGFWQVVPQLGEKIARNGGDAGINGIQITRQNWRLIAAVSLVNRGNNPASFAFEIVLDWGTGRGAVRQWEGTLAPNETLELNASRRVYRGAQAYYMIRVTSGSVWVENVNLWGIQQD